MAQVTVMSMEIEGHLLSSLSGDSKWLPERCVAGVTIGRGTETVTTSVTFPIVDNDLANAVHMLRKAAEAATHKALEDMSDDNGTDN